jgi:hypothetical protein
MGSGDFWPESAMPVPRVVAAAATSARLNWSTDEDLTYDDWLADGDLFDKHDPGWAIGDWIFYGVAHFGNCYAAAVLVTGLVRQRLMHMAAVAAQFAPGRRRLELSLEHHAVVAELNADDQDDWLDLATDEALTSRQLQAEVNAAQHGHVHARFGSERREQLDRRTGADRRGTSLNGFPQNGDPDRRAVTCPHCGEHFTA